MTDEFKIQEENETEKTETIAVGAIKLDGEDAIAFLELLSRLKTAKDVQTRGEEQSDFMRQIVTMSHCSEALIDMYESCRTLKHSMLLDGRYKKEICEITDEMFKLMERYATDCLDPTQEELHNRMKRLILDAGREPDWREPE